MNTESSYCNRKSKKLIEVGIREVYFKMRYSQEYYTKNLGNTEKKVKKTETMDPPSTRRLN